MQQNHGTSNFPLFDKSDEEILQIFSRSGKDEPYDLPRWPDAEIQKRFTGGSGLPLLKRALHLISVLKKDGAFSDEDWKGLDFGCGWGRVASCMLVEGRPDQLDMCDAWTHSLAFAQAGGFKNHLFKVSDIVQPGELRDSYYDFCYAMSVFTHLDRIAFERNLAELVASLKHGGRLYFTVRFESFMLALVSGGKLPEGQKLDETGFWHVTYPGKVNYGETAVDPKFIDRVASRLGQVSYLGLLESEQHLFRLIRN